MIQDPGWIQTLNLWIRGLVPGATTFSITTISIMTLCITTFINRNTEINDTQHISTLCRAALCWVSFILVSQVGLLCRVSLCRMPLCWVSLRQMLYYCATDGSCSVKLITAVINDKLQLTGQNRGRVFNSKSGGLCPMQLCCSVTKLPNLMLKSRPKLLLGSLLLDIALPSIIYGFS